MEHSDKNEQQQLLVAMKADASEIQMQHGFLGMAFHTSGDAQWESEEAFNKGIVQNPVMSAGHDKFS